ncbi:hypothetical protein [uncultured Shewanella sp.]|uniref:hypothetical protein n=1 Tax=uncultured Shewanella sp. TaxID=173975 RepID=UPI003703E48E
MRNIIDNLLGKIKKLVSNQIVYLDSVAFRFQSNDDGSDHRYSFIPLDSVLDKKQSRKSLVTVLSRNCYHEYVQWYPITKKSDLLKVVKLQSKSSILPVLFIIGKAFNGKTPVTYYHLNELSTEVNSWLMLPETSLLAQPFLAETLISYQTLLPENTVFIANGVSGSSSTIKGGVIQSVQQFAMSTGVVATNIVTLTTDDHAKILNQQLKKLYQIPLAGLYSKTRVSFTSFTQLLSKLILPIFSAVTIYLLLVVQLSSFVEQQTKSELRAATKDANEVLNQYNQINNMISRYQLLANKVPVRSEPLLVWQVLAPLYQSGMIISSVRQNKQQITLRFFRRVSIAFFTIVNTATECNKCQFCRPSKSPRQYGLSNCFI